MATANKKGVKQFDYNGDPYVRSRGSSMMSENKGGMQRKQKRFLPMVMKSLAAAAKARRKRG